MASRNILVSNPVSLLSHPHTVFDSPNPTSHPVPSFFMRFWLILACLMSSVMPRPRVIGVYTMPGQTQLTRMFSLPWCAAMARVI